MLVGRQHSLATHGWDHKSRFPPGEYDGESGFGREISLLSDLFLLAEALRPGPTRKPATIHE